MNALRPIAVVCALSIAFISIVTAQDDFTTEIHNGFDMQNPRWALLGVMTGGQPSVADLRLLKEVGYTTVIDLRGIYENRLINEEALVGELGMDYYNIPITSYADLTARNAYRLHQIIISAEGEVFLHCDDGDRAGAMLALRAFVLDGMTSEDAYLVGRLAGMNQSTGAITELIEFRVQD